MAAYYNEDLKNLQARARRLTKASDELVSLKAREQELIEYVEELLRQKEKEDLDVDKLENGGIKAMLYTLIGRMDQKLDKEKREAYEATIRYEEALRELKRIRDDRDAREREIADLTGSEELYRERLASREEEIRGEGGAAAARILELEEQAAFLESQQQEIREAQNAGQSALRVAEQVLETLDSADGYATWDIFGGGMIVDLLKHSELDDAQSQLEHLQDKLNTFHTELVDVTIDAEDIQINIDGFLKFADFFFDGLFADFAVAGEIDDSMAQVRDVADKIEEVLSRLDNLSQENRRNIQALYKEIEDQIVG